jgi:tetratricopeptide (TPR) repeat protein
MASMALRQLGRYGEALSRVQTAIEAFRHRAPGNVAGAIVTRAEVWLDLGQRARALQDRELALRAVTRPVEHRDITLLDLRLAAEADRRGDDPAARGRALLGEELQPYVAMEARLRLVGFATPTEGLADARDVTAAARAAGFRGLEASAMSRASVAEIQAGDVDGAVSHARLAVELADGQGTEDLSWPAILRNAAVVLEQAGLTDEAGRLVARGVAWLHDTAEQHVPSEFRDSFRNRNAANRELQRLAIRLR